jgi:hypothetical protein
MKRLSLYVLCFLVAVLPGCQAMMTPQQQDAAYQTIQAEYRAGRLTRKQRDAACEALEQMQATGDSSTWENLLLMGGSVLASVLTGVPIALGAVQRKRGPVATPAERARRSAACGKKVA